MRYITVYPPSSGLVHTAQTVLLIEVLFAFFFHSAFIFPSPRNQPASPLLGTAFFSVGRRTWAPAQVRASRRVLTKTPPSAALPCAPIHAAPTIQKRKPTLILQEKLRRVQEKRLSTKAATPTPSPFPPVAPVRARFPTPDSPGSDSPRPLTYPSEVRSRRGDQRMRRTCAPEHCVSGRAQQTWETCVWRPDASMPAFAPQVLPCLEWRLHIRSTQVQRSTKASQQKRRTCDLGRISGAAAGASGAAFPDIPAAADSIGHVQRQHSRLGGGAQVQDVTRSVSQSRHTRATHRSIESAPRADQRSGFGAVSERR